MTPLIFFRELPALIQRLIPTSSPNGEKPGLVRPDESAANRVRVRICK